MHENENYTSQQFAKPNYRKYSPRYTPKWKTTNFQFLLHTLEQNYFFKLAQQTSELRLENY